LYNLAEEYIKEGAFDMAKKLIERAEANWSRDVILGDEIGVYHVSWVEQIWLRKAKIYLMTEDEANFEKMTDRILLKRFNFFQDAARLTGESIIGDRCTYSCFELMGAGNRRKNPGYAIGMIKQAITHKGINLNEKYFLLSQKYEKKESMERAYSLYSRFYNKLPNTSYDNTAYGYCRTCKYFNSNICEKLNIKTECTKACLYYNL
jgi:tetratricopeptide (TPR) repeat protein